MVFNLEIDGQHVYSVAGNGLLVHNECSVDLYRAVSPEEFDDVFAAGFRQGPNSFEGKPFVTTLEDALSVADQPALIDAAAVVKTSVPKSLFDQLQFSLTIAPHHVDNGVVTVPRELLDLFNSVASPVSQAF